MGTGLVGLHGQGRIPLLLVPVPLCPYVVRGAGIYASRRAVYRRPNARYERIHTGPVTLLLKCTFGAPPPVGEV